MQTLLNQPPLPLLNRLVFLWALFLACPLAGLAQSPPPLLVEGGAGSQFQLSWSEVPGADIVLEVTDDLSGWQSFPHDPVLANGRFATTVETTGFQRRYFRLRMTIERLPPDPSTVAPPVPPGVPTTLAAGTEFLYTGPDAIQSGVAPNSILPARAAVVRGKITDRAGAPLWGVTVSILNHPEFGQTISRGDGMFDLAVNGGGLLTIHYRRDGYLAVQRQVDVPAQNFATAPDVTMIRFDPKFTEVDLAAAEPMQVAHGTPVTDDDGTRCATVMIPQGTTAEMVMPDGSTQAITSLSIRATEYTVGPNGPQAMPGALPPSSGYTYAVDLCADEALAAGAVDVRFNPPLPFYVENFTEFPVGIDVPLGSYDAARGIWVPSDNGRVIRILSVTGDTADLDVSGDGQADTGAALAALSITDAERQKLAALYAPGQSLWRVLIPHFTPWDLNWPLAPVPGAEFPTDDPESDEVLCEPCTQSGNSIIECQNQILGESFGVAGTEFALHYQSDRAPGYKVPYTLEIPLRGEVTPAQLLGIVVGIDVAGRHIQRTFAPNLDRTFTFLWDGKDAYGRTIEGPQPVTVKIDYVYPAVYVPPSKFGLPSGGAVVIAPARMEATLSRTWTDWIGAWHAPSDGLGGWSLSVHHQFLTNTRFLFRGDGGREAPQFLGSKIDTVAGMPGPLPNGVPTGDGGPATAARFGHARGLAIGPDGSLYVADSFASQIRRIGPDGIISTVAGSLAACLTPTDLCGDGGPATQANLASPYGIAVGPDNSLYIADTGTNRVRKVDPDGIIHTIAGTGVRGFSGDGGPAINAQLDLPIGIAVGSDGAVFVVSGHRVRRIGPDGIITTYAGGSNSVNDPIGDGGPATQARLANLFGIAMGRDGSLYIADGGNHRVRRVTPDGIIRTIAGTGVPIFGGDGGAATQAQLTSPTSVAVGADDSVYIVDRGNNRIRWFRPGGPIQTLAGNGVSDTSGDGGLAVRASLDSLDSGIAVGSDGGVYVSKSVNGARVRRIAPDGERLVNGELAIPARDGSEIFMCTTDGRHSRTLDALTGALRYQFSYGSGNLLAAVTDRDGNLTTIERDGDGKPTAIVSPFGQRTTLKLDEHGFLSAITNAAGEAVQLSHTPEGLLSAVMRPAGQLSMYDFNTVGRLVSATDPTGGTKTLARTGTLRDYTVTLTSHLGKTMTYRVERLQNGGSRMTNTGCENGQSQSVFGIDGHQSTVDASGTTITLDLGADPRWGMRAPIAASTTITTPGGISMTTTAHRSVTLAEPGQLLNVSSLTDTVTTNGRTWTSAYDGATRTLASTSPVGRTGRVVFDPKGRPTQAQIGEFEPTTLTYDERGRVATATQGQGDVARVGSMTYGPNGYLSSATDPLGRIATLTHDTAGRLSRFTLPGGRVVGFAYDLNGNVRGLTPPGSAEHSFAYNEGDNISAYSPPPVDAVTAQTLFTYDADRNSTRIEHPDGGAVQFQYAGGTCRLSLVDLGNRQRTYGYDAAGRPVSLGSSQGITLAYIYDGGIPTSAAWSGAVNGSVAPTYDSELRVTSMSVNTVDPVAIGYDADNLPVQVGGLVITRSLQAGSVMATALGGLSDTVSYDGFGDIAGYNASHDGISVYAATFSRDVLARVSRKSETIAGVTRVIDYSYDVAGRLAEVRHDGVLSASYTWDLNGNRLSRADGTGTVNATYDAQDRQLDYGATTYNHNARGERISRVTAGQATTYSYEGMGNLIGVVLPNGTRIDYLLDALDRRVGKKVDGTLVQAFLYQDGLRPIAELDGSGAVITRFVYAAGIITPDYMVKGGITYRIITDQLGSPRLVIDVVTGQIAQRMDHDEFGVVTLDTNPGFQPFGFAGGLYDRLTGLVHFGAREYDPDAGRWTVKDPLTFAAGDGNLYAYSGNDPVNNIDPGGLCFSTLCGCAKQPGICAAIGLGGRIAGPHAQRVFDNVRRVAAAAPRSVTRVCDTTSRVSSRASTVPGIGVPVPVAPSPAVQAVINNANFAAARARDIAERAAASQQARNVAYDEALDLLTLGERWVQQTQRAVGMEYSTLAQTIESWELMFGSIWRF
ncbi:MAG: RHS repeat-associated core domain-containing protein [Verrucomicrobiales bacterium]